MLPGVVPFPPDFAARYRAKGYWQDKSLRPGIRRRVPRLSPSGSRSSTASARFTYRDIDNLSDNLALNLLELGLEAARPRRAVRCRTSPSS